VCAWGIEASVSESDRGRTINISDPDGNRVGLRGADHYHRSA